MARTYKVRVTAGTHTWTVTDTDPPTAGLMDPLTIGWALPDTEHRPSQPDPMVATFAVIAATAADLDDLVLGDAVTIEVTFNPDTKTIPDIVFYGRIAQGQASPHPSGMLYQFTCADATVDLAGYDIGATTYLAGPVTGRIAALLARAGVPDVDLVRDPVMATVDPNLYVDQVDQPGAANLLTTLIGLCDQVGMAGTNDLTATSYRPILAPYPGPSSAGLPFRWALDVVPDQYVPTEATMLPAQFGHWFPDPGGWGLKLDPDDRAAGVIDACVVEFGSAWAAIAPAVADRAAVTWLTAGGADPDLYERAQQVTYTVETPPGPGKTPTTTTRETQTIGIDAATTTAAAANAGRLGGLMVPAPQNPAGWAPDSFRWLLYADPAGLADFPVLFPRHDATIQATPVALRTSCYVRPVVVTGLLEEWNAADGARDWVGGQLSTIQLTISDGRPVVDFQLVPTLPEPGNVDASTRSWNTRAGTWNAQTGAWDDLVPGRIAFRWNDTQLVGRVWNDLHPQDWNMYRLARGN